MTGGADRAIGVDVGGTKIAAGVVDLRDGSVSDPQHRRTRPERDGAEILDDVVTIVSALMQDQSAVDVGVAVCELVDLDGQVTSDQTLDWLGRDVVGAIAGAVAGAGAVTVSSDVRAGALAEARLGAGRSLDPFLYVSVGTGVSHTLVQAGTPYAGRHGSALVATSGTHLRGLSPLRRTDRHRARSDRVGAGDGGQVLRADVDTRTRTSRRRAGCCRCRRSGRAADRRRGWFHAGDRGGRPGQRPRPRGGGDGWGAGAGSRSLPRSVPHARSQHTSGRPPAGTSRSSMLSSGPTRSWWGRR